MSNLICKEILSIESEVGAGYNHMLNKVPLLSKRKRLGLIHNTLIKKMVLGLCGRF